MRRAASVALLAVAALLALVLAPSAGAAASAGAGSAPAKVSVGKVRLVEPASGQPSLLVAVRYPIEMAGRVVRLRIALRGGDGQTLQTATVMARANAGPRRMPERRQRFAFVHRLAVEPMLVPILRNGGSVTALAVAPLDVDLDGKSEFLSTDSATQPLALAGPASRLCASVPVLRTSPGKAIGVELPVCAGDARWALVSRPEEGGIRIRDGRLVYRPGKRFRGTATAMLEATPPAGARASAQPLAVPIQITVGAAEAPVVRALGDSVTAGFGYYEDGSQMSIARLFPCRPPVGKYDDACSSNSKVQSNTVKEVEYAADYGLSNNVSWVAQWANEHGATNFKNFAISGSRPQDWFGAGQFASTTKELEAEDPDYVLLTIGANPILTETLFGIDNMGCAVWADIFGEYQACIERAFDKVKLAENLRGLYSELVKNTDAQIIAMQYHLSVPSSAIAYTAAQIAEMANLMNAEIAAAAAAVSKSRIDVVAPPHFNVGISLAPVYPAKYKCKGLLFDSRVDGPSVQSTPSQVFLRVDHPFEFCGGPVSGPPWVISGDTGIHPSAAGYAQMASQVPAPE